MEHILILNIYAFQNESHLREHLHVQINIFRIGLPDRSVLSKGDRAVDIGAAPLTVGRSAAERDMDGEDTVATSILVGGQERTQGIDVLVSNGAISPAHGPSVRKRERGSGVGEVLIIYLRIRRQYKCQLHGTYLREQKNARKEKKIHLHAGCTHSKPPAGWAVQVPKSTMMAAFPRLPVSGPMIDPCGVP